MFQPVLQQPAVGQVGQGVVKRQPADFVLLAFLWPVMSRTTVT
jgi:hypothetical protein